LYYFVFTVHRCGKFLQHGFAQIMISLQSIREHLNHVCGTLLKFFNGSLMLRQVHFSFLHVVCIYQQLHGFLLIISGCLCDFPEFFFHISINPEGNGF